MANSDHVDVLSAAIEIQTQSDSKSYVAYYFQGKFTPKKLFQREKINGWQGHLSQGGYAEFGLLVLLCHNKINTVC